jgi:hypothetical protein
MEQVIGCDGGDMEVYLLKETGYEEAMLGISLSWASTVARAKDISIKLAFKQGGHNKFLESIMIWLDVTAPRYWWQEFDTYRVGVTKQSASTMHTITKRTLEHEDFEMIDGVVLDYLNEYIISYQDETDPIRKKEKFYMIKNLLPEGFLQRRIVCMNMKTLQNMYAQRKNHKLPEWRNFFNDLFRQLDNADLIVEEQ